jgi:hypothetical protein
VLNPSDVFPLGKTDGGEGVPCLHHGSVFNPGLFKCRFPDNLPHMVCGQGFPVNIKERDCAVRAAGSIPF